MLAKIVAGAFWVVILGWFPATFVFLLISIWSDDPRWYETAKAMAGVGLLIVVATVGVLVASKKEGHRRDQRGTRGVDGGGE